jgi:hypothetical protein
MAKPKQQQGSVKDLVTRFERIDPKKIRPHPHNPRVHLETQRKALQAMLEKYGIVDAIVVRKDGNHYELINGHLRHEEIRQKIPALVIDATREEAAKLLATYDPISTLATINKNALDKLIKSYGEVDPRLAPVMDRLLEASLAMEDAHPSKPAPQPREEEDEGDDEPADTKKKPPPADTNLINFYFSETDHKFVTETITKHRETVGKGHTTPVPNVILDILKAVA